MKVINIDQEQVKKKQQDLLEVIEDMKQMITDGEVEEFVATSISPDGDILIHAACKDFIGGVGLFEIGKRIFIESKD